MSEIVQPASTDDQSRAIPNSTSPDNPAQILTHRNLDHLSYDENLYDFMKSLIPFSITTSNKSLNHYLLSGDSGLEKNEFINVYYNDTAGKRELIYEMVLSATLPKEWGQSEDPCVIQEGQELGAILVDIQGSFSVYKYVQKIRDYYEKHNLIQGSTPEGGFENEDEKQTAITNDKHLFIKAVLQNFYIFNCMDAAEFNLTIRSLAKFFKSHKSIGMVVLDGLHFIENLEYINQMERRHLHEQMKEKQPGSTKQNFTANLEGLGDNVPDADDFLGGGPEDKKQEVEPLHQNNQNQRKSMILPTRNKRGNVNDSKAFDQKLVDRALSLLLDYQQVHQFSIVKCQARPYMKKSADLQEEVMTKGIHPDAIPQSFGLDQQQQSYEIPNLNQPGLHGYGQIVLEGQMQTDDDILRERIKQLRQGEVLILKGDRDNSLANKEQGKLNDNFMTQHLSCMIMSHHQFPHADKVDSQRTKYLNRYVALYVLFRTDLNLYQISDDVAKSFYI